MNIYIGLTEQMGGGAVPDLSYLLSGEGRVVEPVSSLMEVTPQTGEAQAWQGSFTLPADAGLGADETLAFVYTGQDDLGNVSNEILVPNRFQVYQGDLPPLTPPEGLKGDSLPGGQIKLTWNAVQNAAGYQLYRQAPNESELAEYAHLDSVEEYIDAPVKRERDRRA